MSCKNQPETIDDLTDKEPNALTTVQELLISPPILAFPRAKNRYMVDTDAFD